MSEKNPKFVTNLKYRPEFPGMLVDYINECLADDRKPILFDFMRRISVFDRKTIYRWAEEKKEFGYAYEMYKEASRNVIVEKALSGAYDASFSKFLLSCDYGMKEKTQVDIGGADEKAFKVNITVVD